MTKLHTGVTDCYTVVRQLVLVGTTKCHLKIHIMKDTKIEKTI